MTMRYVHCETQGELFILSFNFLVQINLELRISNPQIISWFIKVVLDSVHESKLILCFHCEKFQSRFLTQEAMFHDIIINSYALFHRSFISAKRNHEDTNSYKGEHFIGDRLQVPRFIT